MLAFFFEASPCAERERSYCMGWKRKLASNLRAIMESEKNGKTTIVLCKRGLIGERSQLVGMNGRGDSLLRDVIAVDERRDGTITSWKRHPVPNFPTAMWFYKNKLSPPMIGFLLYPLISVFLFFYWSFNSPQLPFPKPHPWKHTIK